MAQSKEKEFIFHQTYLKALLENRNNTAHWISYKEKYQDVIKNLKFYVEKSKHDVCIPVGKKAFVKGELVHTNDVWVTLGCGWFLKTSVKTAVEICERRIKEADELIDKWEKESKLLESMREFSVNKGAFGNPEDSKEIIEPFDVNSEEKWREEHREKEKKYRQQLKDVKNKTETAVLKDEKDLWEHLDALELQEELEDELNRLGCSDSSSDGYESDSGESEDSAMENSDNVTDDNSVMDNSDFYSVPDTSKNKIHVTINKPNEDVPQIEVSPKLQRKKVTFNIPDEEEIPEVKEVNMEKQVPDAVLDEVIEKIPSKINDSMDKEQKRPVSKFKLNRMK